MKTVRNRVFSELGILKKVRSDNGLPELNKFLKNSRATPITPTGVHPATALFVTPIKTKLHKLITRSTDDEMRKYHRKTMVKIERHPDSEWYVKPPIIKEGDKVLVKRDDSKKKSDTSYNTTPSIEFDMKESTVTAEA